MQLAPKAVSEIHAESDEILTNTIVIQFFPNSWDLYKKINRDEDGKATEVLYDPNVDNVLAGSRQAGRAVRQRPDHRRRSHRQLAARPGSRVAGEGAEPESGQRGARGAREQVSRWIRTGSPPPAWAGTGRPIRTIRRTTPRTAASKSRSTRPKKQ